MLSLYILTVTFYHFPLRLSLFYSVVSFIAFSILYTLGIKRLHLP